MDYCPDIFCCSLTSSSILSCFASSLLLSSAPASLSNPSLHILCKSFAGLRLSAGQTVPSHPKADALGNLFPTLPTSYIPVVVWLRYAPNLNQIPISTTNALKAIPAPLDTGNRQYDGARFMSGFAALNLTYTTI